MVLVDPLRRWLNLIHQTLCQIVVGIEEITLDSEYLHVNTSTLKDDGLKFKTFVSEAVFRLLERDPRTKLVKW